LARTLDGKLYEAHTERPGASIRAARFDEDELMADSTTVQNPAAGGADAAEAQKVQKITGIFQVLDRRWSKFRQEQLRNYEYIVDNQLTDEVRKQLQAEHRPELVFNLLLPLILFIAGTLATNKTRLRAMPLRHGDEEGADMHTVLVSDWAIENCDGYYEIAKASIDAAIAKIGWTNNFWDIRDVPEGKWITRSWDPLMVMFDPDARTEDQTDWRYLTVSAFYSVEEIIGIFQPDPATADLMRQRAKDIEGSFPKDGKPQGWINRVWNGITDDFLGQGFEGTRDRVLVDNLSDARNGLYRVIEFHDKRQMTKRTVYDPTTRNIRVIEGDEDEGETDKQTLYEQSIDQLWISAVCPRLLPEKPLLEKPYPVQNRGFQFKPIFCYTLHPDMTRGRAIIDSVMGAQDSFNQRMMTELELIMDAVNPDYVALKGSIAPEDLPAWMSKERGVMKFYKDAAMQPDRESPLPQAFQGVGEYGEKSAELVQKLSGISPNMQGFKETNREGAALYNQRVQAGLTMLNYFLSHIQRSMEQIFGYCDRNVQEFLTMPRAVRMLGEPLPEMEGVVMDQKMKDYYWLQVNWPTLDGVLNDVSQGEYDFRPDQTQLGQTAKQMKYVEMLELFKVIPPQFAPYDLLAEAWDSPYSKKVVAYIRQQMGMAQQLQAQKAAAEKAKMTMEIADQAMSGDDVKQLAEGRRE
jgi:hypothetical protein